MGRRAANAVRRDAAVKLAAIELCESNGYASVSVADIAARSGVNARTIFRTFGSKAGIFWHNPFLSRIVSHVDAENGPRHPLEALLSATASAAGELSPQDRDIEARRRAVVLSEPDLRGIGALSVSRSIAELVERLTPIAADAELRRRLSLFALFAAMAIAFEPLDPNKPVDDWIGRLQDGLMLAAHGPIPKPATRAHE
jgi:AcrR family transcriptional regulator